MKISIVTISYNQAQFIEEAILSVVSQSYANFEYIIVDAGSTDGSRKIIEQYEKSSEKIITIFEEDKGPADGLNKGFKKATGDIFCFLNSDDKFLPSAFEKIVNYFAKNPFTDIVSGHAFVIDGAGKTLRRVYSDRFSLLSYAYRSSILIQPSTFFRQSAYAKVNKFNIMNHCCWDGELFVDLHLKNSSFSNINEFLSCYRLHSFSITATGKLEELTKDYHDNIFRRIIGRKFNLFLDILPFIYFRIIKHLKNPKNVFEKIFFGNIYKRNA